MTAWCLSVAGWDPSAGAGVLADVATFGAFGIRGCALLTAVTAQNRGRVVAVHPVPPAWYREQARALLSRGPPAAVKVGMLGSAALVRETARLLRGLRNVPVVVDPVLRASTGGTLLDRAGLRALRRDLLPLATVVTPNREEASRLLGRTIRDRGGMLRAARELRALGCAAVVVTGGDRRGAPLDVLVDGRGERLFTASRIPVEARGTGCRHSTALAALLAQGRSLRQAAAGARSFVRRYLASLL